MARFYFSFVNIFQLVSVILLVVFVCLYVTQAQSAEPTNAEQTQFSTPDQKAEKMARSALAVGRLIDVEDDLIGLLRVSPTSTVAHYWLARLNLEKGDSEAAISSFRKSIENDPANMLARLELASVLEQTNDLASAAEILEFVLRLYPKDLNARASLAAIRLNQKDLISAMKEYSLLIKLAPTHPNVKDMQKLLDSLHMKRAEELSGKLFYKKDQQLALRTARNWIREKRIAPAQRLLQEFLLHHKDNALANYYTAIIYQSQGDMSLALKYFSLSVTDENEVKNVDFLYGYANALLRVGKQKKAQTIFSKVALLADEGLIKTESKKQSILLRGEILGKESDFRGALDLFKNAVEHEDANLTYLGQLGKIQTRLNMSVEAAATFQRMLAVKQASESNLKQIQHARTLISKGDMDGAELRLQEILKFDPSHSQALYWLSVVYEKQEKYDSAVHYLRQSVNSAKGNISLKKSLARLLALAGRSKEAVAIYDNLAEKSTDDDQIKELERLSLFVWGQYLTQNNNFKKARKHYLLMSKKLPKDIVVLEALASIYIQLGELGRAEKVYLKAIKIDDKRALTYLRLAGLYSQMSKDEKRREYYKRTLVADPVGDSGKKALGNMLLIAQEALDAGHLEKAFEEYGVVLSVFPNQVTAVRNGARVAQNIPRLKAAEVLYRRLIHNNPSKFKYRVEFAGMYIRINDLDNAIREYEALYAIAPITIEGREANANLDILYSTKADQIILKLNTEAERTSAIDTARIWVQEKNRTVPARRILLAVLAKDKDNEKAHYWLGTIFDRNHDFELAVFHIARSISLAPYNLQLLTAFGRVLARSGNLDSAEAIYKKVLYESEGTPLAAVTKKSLGFIVAQRHVQKGDLEKALAQYQVMSDDFPDDAGLLARIASVFLSNNEYEKAANIFQQVIEIEPNSPSVYLQIAKLHQKQGDELARKEALRKVIALDPNGILGRQALDAFGLADGMLKLKESQWLDAIAIFNHVLTIEPDNSYATVALGSAYLGLGDFEKSEAVFLKMLKIDPGNLDARLKLARVYVSSKRTALAVLELERVVAVSRETKQGKEALVNLTNIYRERGAALLKKGKGDEAVREYRKAVSKDKDDWQAHFVLGKLFQEGSKTASMINRKRFLDLASHHFSETVRVRPENYDVHVKLATIYESTQDYNRARDSFAYALSLLNADDSRVRNVLINAIRMQIVRNEFAAEHFSWVLGELKEMLLLEPESLRLHLFLGILYIRMSDLESAIISTNKAVKLSPQNVTARIRLGRLYEQTNDLERAADQYRAVIFTSKSGTMVDAARERLSIIEEKLSLFTFRMRYVNAVGGSWFADQPEDRNFSSTLSLGVTAHFQPEKNIDIALNASPSYSSFHDTENDSISTTYGITSNITFKNGSATAMINQRKIEGLLLETESGNEKNMSLAISHRMKVPLLFSESGVVPQSTLRFQMGVREFKPSISDTSFYHIRTPSLSSTFIYPFQRGGALSFNYIFSETFNLQKYGSDYANKSHDVVASISRPLINKLFVSLSAGLRYEGYTNIDSIRYRSLTQPQLPHVEKRRKTAQGTFSLAFNYRLHRKLSIFFDVSLIRHRTNIEADGGIYRSNPFRSEIVNNRTVTTVNVGGKGSVLYDYDTYRSSGGIQFQF